MTRRIVIRLFYVERDECIEIVRLLPAARDLPQILGEEE